MFVWGKIISLLKDFFKKTWFSKCKLAFLNGFPFFDSHHILHALVYVVLQWVSKSLMPWNSLNGFTKNKYLLILWHWSVHSFWLFNTTAPIVWVSWTSPSHAEYQARASNQCHRMHTRIEPKYAPRPHSGAMQKNDSRGNKVQYNVIYVPVMAT